MKQILKRYFFIWGLWLFEQFVYWADQSRVLSWPEIRLLELLWFTVGRLRGNVDQDTFHNMLEDWMDLDGTKVDKA